MEAVTDETETPNIILPYKPFREQLLFHQNKSRFRSMFCGGRGGKTTAGANEGVFFQSWLRPGSFGRIIAPTYRMLDDINIPEVLFWLEEYRRTIPGFDYEFLKSKLEIVLSNGSSFQFRSAEDPRKLRGRGKMDWAWLDEFAYFSEEAWNVIYVRLMDRGGCAFGTTTPVGRNWAYKRFWLPAKQGDPNFWAIRYPTWASPYIDSEMIEQARQTLTARYFKQEYEASFEAFEGAVYPEFSLNAHGISENDIGVNHPKIEDMDIIVGIDEGYGHPAAIIWIGVAPYGHVYMLDELVKNGLRIREKAEYIKNHPLYRGKERTMIYIDPRAAQQCADYGNNGVFPIQAKITLKRGFGPNERATRVNRVGEYMKVEANGTTHFHVIVEKCPELVDGISRYKYLDNGQAEKENDDAVDAMAYGLSMLPEYDEREHEKEQVYHSNPVMNERIKREKEKIKRLTNPDYEQEWQPDVDPMGTAF